MSIDGICHDFAFSRCSPAAQWSTTDPAVADPDLWPRVQGNMTRVDPNNIGQLDTGVLTIVDPQRTVAAYCVHSYYVDQISGFLLSTNDPFMDQVKNSGGLVVPVAVGDTGVTATSYSLADFINCLTIGNDQTARVGDRPYNYSFYWANADNAVVGWWN